MEAKKFIDVEKIIADKNPKALKWTPGFLIRYIKRVLHQKEINAFLNKHRDLKNAAFCQAVIKYFDIKIDVKYLDRIPKEGKIVLAMNHPLGGMDAMILVHALQGHRNDLKFIVNDILMNLENLSEMFVGVNKHGKNSQSTREQIDELFQSNEAVCIFPAGLVSRKSNGEIMDLNWKKTFITYSRAYDRTVIPIYIDGGLSNFFYNLSNLRKKIGIKANIEMLYLSNELFKQRGKNIRFVIGEPIDLKEMNPSKTDHDLAQEIKETVYELRKEL
jgi:putative hemolysin